MKSPNSQQQFEKPLTSSWMMKIRHLEHSKINKIMEVFLTFVKFQRFILKPRQNNKGFFNIRKILKVYFKVSTK